MIVTRITQFLRYLLISLESLLLAKLSIYDLYFFLFILFIVVYFKDVCIRADMNDIFKSIKLIYIYSRVLKRIFILIINIFTNVLYKCFHVAHISFSIKTKCFLFNEIHMASIVDIGWKQSIGHRTNVTDPDR